MVRLNARQPHEIGVAAMEMPSSRPPPLSKPCRAEEEDGTETAMIRSMTVVHMSEADVVKDIAAVMAKVRQGTEIVIELGNRPVAVIKPSKSIAGRMISEVIADLKARGSSVVMDDDFAQDIADGIKSHGQQWNPSSWE
jgi:antitoxin (DNA-binding transcriptional repressor) of toxin-antitoxin stability system